MSPHGDARPGGQVAHTQEERKTETRARLLAAAAGLFDEHGFDAVSVDAVADAADRTSGAVYSHFGSKQGLLLALLDDWMQSVTTVLFAEVAVAEQPRRQLEAVWDNASGGRRGGIAGAGGGRLPLLEHELWLRAARDPEVARLLRARNLEARRRTARGLERWTAQVDGRPVAPDDQAAILVKALLVGLDMQERLEPGSVDDDTAVRGLAALLGLPGLAGPAGLTGQAAPAAPAAPAGPAAPDPDIGHDIDTPADTADLTDRGRSAPVLDQPSNTR